MRQATSLVLGILLADEIKVSQLFAEKILEEKGALERAGSNH